MGAPIGNQNAAKGRKWVAAINRALERRSLAAQVDALDELAEKLLAACDEGDLQALKELGDRLDGKAPQGLQLTGADDGPIKHEFGWAKSDE
jgi:hypothetical protein